MMNPTRREFIKRAVATGAAVQLLGPKGVAAEVGPTSVVSRQGRQDRPLFVDGLSFMPSDLTAIPESGLDAFILDVSSVAQIP